MTNLLAASTLYRRRVCAQAERLGAECAFLRGSSVLITGATGLLGSYLVDLLAVRNRDFDDEISLHLVGRSRARAQMRFGELFNGGGAQFYEWDAGDEREFPPVNYIIHAASNADPRSFSTDPVGTMRANVAGTQVLLENARRFRLKKFLYISSGEVYGDTRSLEPTQEDSIDGILNWMAPRSCYPYGKRSAELLCMCYREQFEVASVIARPCHLYGPTQMSSDSRAIAQFIRAAARGEDIVLMSDGLARRSYCYISDAAAALLLLLREGKSGEAYNISDPEGLTTVRNVAEMVAEVKGREVRFEVGSAIDTKGHSKVGLIALDSRKIRQLGWTPTVSIKDGLRSSVEILCELEQGG